MMRDEAEKIIRARMSPEKGYTAEEYIQAANVTLTDLELCKALIERITIELRAVDRGATALGVIYTIENELCRWRLRP